LVVFFICESCNQRIEQNKDKQIVRRQTIGLGDVDALEQTLITVPIGSNRSAIDISDEHLHGRFFQDRAEFFVVEQPLLYLADTKVEELTLYFIDDVLCKKKYELASDISTDLMRTYGTFKFRALNDSSKTIAKKEGVLQKSTKKKTMNQNMNYYRMRWPNQKPALYYEYKRDSVEERRLLIEELSEYKNLLREAERSI